MDLFQPLHYLTPFEPFELVLDLEENRPSWPKLSLKKEFSARFENMDQPGVLKIRDWLGKQLRIAIQDKRIFQGIFTCVDRVFPIRPKQKYAAGQLDGS